MRVQFILIKTYRNIEVMSRGVEGVIRHNCRNVKNFFSHAIKKTETGRILTKRQLILNKNALNSHNAIVPQFPYTISTKCSTQLSEWCKPKREEVNKNGNGLQSGHSHGERHFFRWHFFYNCTRFKIQLGQQTVSVVWRDICGSGCRKIK